MMSNVLRTNTTTTRYLDCRKDPILCSILLLFGEAGPASAAYAARKFMYPRLASFGNATRLMHKVPIAGASAPVFNLKEGTDGILLNGKGG